MTSKQSDTGSNVSGFIKYGDAEIKKLYSSALKSMETINQDVQEVQRNLSNIVGQAGHLEKHVVGLMHNLPMLNDWKPESRNEDFAQNKLVGYQGSGVSTVIRHDSHSRCHNFATTTDVVYRHQPRPLCGPPQRYYRRSAHIYYPQPDLMECFGNITEWGLRKYLAEVWKCARESDYMNTCHEVAYTPPHPVQYLQPADRKARDSSFTKTFRFKMTKPITSKKSKQQ